MKDGEREEVEVCPKCGSKRALWKAPCIKKPIRVIAPPVEKLLSGFPLLKEHCKACDKWLEG